MMKKFVSIVLFVIVVSQVNAQLVKQRPVIPFVPKVMAMGGGYTGHAEGIYSLWYNPAGLSNNYIKYFARNFGKEITAFTLSAKLQPMPQDAMTIYNEATSADANLNGLNKTVSILDKSGARVGTSIYGGYIKHFYDNIYLGAMGLSRKGENVPKRER